MPTTTSSISRPRLNRGEVAHWPGCARWDLDYLSEVAGDTLVPVEHCVSEAWRTDADWPRVVMPLRAYCRLIREEPAAAARFYLAEVRVDETLPMLESDFSAPDCVGKPSIVTLFVGVDSFTPIHFHAITQAVLCQVLGSKTVVLVPPEATKRLPLMPVVSRRYNFARLPRMTADEVVELVRALGYEPEVARVEPGDTLEIPVHWGHMVEGPGPTISVTYFWHARASEWQRSVLARRSLVGWFADRSLVNPVMRWAQRWL